MARKFQHYQTMDTKLANINIHLRVALDWSEECIDKIRLNEYIEIKLRTNLNMIL